MVGGGSIFGKYLWRVETTELERTYSISVSLSLSLSLSVCLSLSLSLSLSHSSSLYSWSAGCLFRDPNTIRGCLENRVGVLASSRASYTSVQAECWSRQRPMRCSRRKKSTSSLLFPPRVAASPRGSPTIIDRVPQRSVTFDLNYSDRAKVRDRR